MAACRAAAVAMLQQAGVAALEHTGQGGVMGIEFGDEAGTYEVDVRLDDGSDVEVYLNEDFAVVGQR